MYLYRIDAYKKDSTRILDTEEFIDLKRIKRYSELKPLFAMFYKHCNDHNESIEVLVQKIISLKSGHEVTNSEDKIQILNLSKNLNFNWLTDQQHLIDYLLELSKEEVEIETNRAFPIRHQSQFFFASIEDCYIYINKIKKRHNLGKLYITTNEVIELRSFLIADNNLLANINFQSVKLLQRRNFNDYYLEKKTFNPLPEITFCGKYKIIARKKIDMNPNFLKRIFLNTQKLFND
jgi:hypothetical protein